MQAILMFVAWLAILFALPALAHDSWISKKAYRNNMNEYCCGENDCFPVQNVEEVAGGWHVWGEQPGLSDRIVDGTHGKIMRPFDEVIPLSETLPSMDNQFWRCALQNGKRRCFFAPPPST